MERSTEIDREAELAIKQMTDAEIREMFITEQIDLLKEHGNDYRTENGIKGALKRWRNERSV